MGNITDTARLAEKCVINLCDGRITALLVPREQGMFNFGKCENIVVPWDKIECIGEDAILIKISPCEYDDCRCDRDKKEKKKFSFG